jgi:branched-chain amino acid aminotransferase
MSRSVTWSKTVTFFEDDWHEGNLPIMGVRTHAAWLCTSVFDGARAFESVTPDLDLHCARVNESAKVISLKPLVSTETWMTLAREGLKRFDRDAELYIRPMYWPEDAASGAVRPDPETTRWCLTLYVAPLPKPTGTAITLSPFRRPTRESAPVDAKAGCLYPNNARAMIEARSRGFDNCLMCDMLATSPNSPPRMFSWSRTAWRIRLRPTALFSPASRAAASWRSCARQASR